MFYYADYGRFWNLFRREKPASVEVVPAKPAEWLDRQKTHVEFYGIISHLNLIERAAEDLQPHYDAIHKIHSENAGSLPRGEVGAFVVARNKLVAAYALRQCDLDQVAAFCKEAASQPHFYDQSNDEIRGKEQ